MATQGYEREVVVLAGKRTGFGTFGGSLKGFSATDLGVFSSAAAIEAAGISPDQVDHTFFGNALQTSADAIYLARHIALRAGIPDEKPKRKRYKINVLGEQKVETQQGNIVFGKKR